MENTSKRSLVDKTFEETLAYFKDYINIKFPMVKIYSTAKLSAELVDSDADITIYCDISKLTRDEQDRIKLDEDEYYELLGNIKNELEERLTYQLEKLISSEKFPPEVSSEESEYYSYRSRVKLRVTDRSHVIKQAELITLYKDGVWY